jgi:hypothetical protein
MVAFFELFFDLAQRFQSGEKARQLLLRQALYQQFVDFMDRVADRVGRDLSPRRVDQIGNSVGDGTVTESYVAPFDEGLEETYSRGLTQAYLSKELSRADTVGESADDVGAVSRKVVTVDVREVVTDEPGVTSASSAERRRDN